MVRYYTIGNQKYLQQHMLERTHGPRKRGGGAGPPPFETFPKNHLVWKVRPSLRMREPKIQTCLDLIFWFRKIHLLLLPWGSLDTNSKHLSITTFWGQHRLPSLPHQTIFNTCARPPQTSIKTSQDSTDFHHSPHQWCHGVSDLLSFGTMPLTAV